MEFLEMIKTPNQFLEQYAVFRGLKFVMAVYLIILFLDIVILLYFLVIEKHYWWDFSFGRSMPKIRGIMSKRWREIVNIVRNKESEKYKMAVIEARDALFEVFSRIGYDGKDLKQQLDLMIGYQVSNLNELKEANLVAEEILKDANYRLSEEVAKKTLLAFGKALWEMEAIKEIGFEE